MTTFPVTEAKQNLEKLIEQVIADADPIMVIIYCRYHYEK